MLELKDKVKKEGLLEQNIKIPLKTDNSLAKEALSALMTLGIGKPAAEKTINMIIKEYGSDIRLEELIKLALKRA